MFHPRNRGKGAAIKTGISEATGEIIIIQDADLEYHPEDYPVALRLIEQGWADAVYGSRFLGPHRVFLFWHYVANKCLTLIANMLTSGMLTDMETGFKVMRADVLKRLDIQSYTFNFEVEVTIKLFRYGYRVYEIPITYTGPRGREEDNMGGWCTSTLGFIEVGSACMSPYPLKSRLLIYHRSKATLAQLIANPFYGFHHHTSFFC